MQNKELELKLDQWISVHREELVEQVIAAVNIKSVAQPDRAAEYPLKECCGRILEHFEAVGENYGFPAQIHEYYCTTARMKGLDGRKTIGIFGHADVVPEGDDWTVEPYNASVKDGFIYGRGSLDNKGAIVSSLFAMRFLQEQNYPLKSDVLLYCGAAEEHGMEDVVYYGKKCGFPDFSIVPDASFPACYGEKGIIELYAEKELETGNLVALEAGHAINIVPNTAVAVLKNVSLETLREAIGNDTRFTAQENASGTEIQAVGQGGHAAFPEQTVNAIGLLVTFLTEHHLLTGQAKTALEMISESCADYYGQGLGIAYEDAFSGKTTHVCSKLRLKEGVLTVGYNIRYAVTQPEEAMVEQLRQFFRKGGFTVTVLDVNPPAYMPLDNPIVSRLVRLAQRVLGDDHAPYTMGGGTYARKIPNALAYGPHIQGEVQPGGIGRGSGHQPDECMKIENLLNAVKVYALALIEADEALYQA